MRPLFSSIFQPCRVSGKRIPADLVVRIHEKTDLHATGYRAEVPSLRKLALQKGVVMAKVSRQVIVISIAMLIASAGTKSALW
jgi:hypothetical protein